MVDFGGLRRARPVLVVGLGTVAAVYLLARNESISNWWFVVITGLTIVAMPAAGRLLAPAPPAPAAGVAASTAGGAGPDASASALPLELVGVSRPYELADRDMLDRELGLPLAGRKG
jgi:hypothetical protein